MESRLNAIQTLTNVQLRNLLRLIGSPTSGSKRELGPRLLSYQSHPRFHYNADGRTRILSVDMGVRNLAFCVVDVQREHLGSGPQRVPSPLMTIRAWKRIDPVRAVVETDGLASESPLSMLNNPFVVTSDARAADPWAPRHLAHITYSLLKKHLLTWTPQITLIEQQRYRSGGGPGVFEWTLRVNKLESMLWAALETMNQENLQTDGKRAIHPNVSEVSPQRVASFWIDAATSSDTHSPQEAKKNGSANSKREKIDLVRSWLSAIDADTGVAKIGSGLRNTHIRLAVDRDAEIPNRKLRAWTSPELERQSTGKRNALSHATKKIEDEDSSTKMDDLADCLLQAMAWVAWESNRDGIADMSPEKLAAVADACGS